MEKEACFILGLLAIKSEHQHKIAGKTARIYGQEGTAAAAGRLRLRSSVDRRADCAICTHALLSGLTGLVPG